MTTLLFVYGTLRRHSPHPMARELARRACYLGGATIGGRLYDLGRYPGLLEPVTDTDRVEGDLYDLGPNAAATLAEMDEYERVESPQPAYFDRRLAAVTREDEVAAPAWVYWYRGEVAESQRIVSGRYEGPRTSGATVMTREPDA